MKNELDARSRFLIILAIYLGGMGWALYDFSNQMKWGLPAMLALAAVLAALSLGYWFLYARRVVPGDVTKPLAIAAGFGLVFYLLTFSPWASLMVIFPGLSGLLLPALRTWQGNFSP